MTSFRKKSARFLTLKLLGRQVWREGGNSVQRTLYSTFLAIIVLLVYAQDIGRASDRLQLSALTYLQGSRPHPTELVVIGIDNHTYESWKLKTSEPIPRHLTASTLKRLHDASPNAIFMDAYIPDEEDPSNEELKSALFAGRTIIGYGLETFHSFGQRITSVAKSSPYFEEAAFDSIPLVERPYGSLSALMSLGISPKEPCEKRVPLFNPLQKLLPSDLHCPGAEDFINYYGPPGTITYESMVDVANAPFDSLKDLVKDRILFIGFAAHSNKSEKGAKELFNIPGTRKQMFGVEVIASRAGNLIDGTFIRRFSPSTDNNILLFATLLTSLTALHLVPIASIVFILSTTVIWLIASYISFVHFHHFLPGAGLIVPVAVLMSVAILFFQSNWYKEKIEATEKLFRMKLFQKTWNEKSSKKRRLLIATTASCLTLLLWLSPLERVTKEIGLNVLFELSRSRAVPSDVVIVGIDDYSVNELGTNLRQPFPPSVLSEAITLIHEAHPSLLIADLLLSRELPGFGEEQLIDALRGGLSVIGYRPDENGEPKNNLKIHYPGAASAWVPLSFWGEEDKRTSLALNNDGSLSDEKRFPLLQPLNLFLGKNIKAPETNALINYYGPPGAIPRVSLKDFLEFSSDKREKLLSDHLVLLSYQTVMHRRELSDNMQHYVPGFNRKMFDSEIHATILSNLLDGSYIRRLSPSLEGAIIFGASLLILVAASLLSPVLSAGAILIGTLSWAGATYYLFNNSYLFIPGFVEFLIVLPFATAVVLFSEAKSALAAAKKAEEALGGAVKIAD